MTFRRIIFDYQVTVQQRLFISFVWSRWCALCMFRVLSLVSHLFIVRFTLFFCVSVVLCLNIS